MKRLVLFGFLVVLLLGVAVLPANAQTAIWRLQLQVVTGNVNNAGTDDDIYIRLNQDNITWLNYGRDDFERNSDHTYDLLQNGYLRTMGDITRVQFSKNGSNGWCVREFRILVNGGDYVFSQRFNPCAWLDNDNGHSRTYTVNNPRFRFAGLVTIRPDSLGRRQVESLLESAVGHRLYDHRLDWDNRDGRVVEVSRESRDSLRVDLDLELRRSGSDRPVDVDYIIRFPCNNGRLGWRVAIPIGTDSSLTGLIEYSSERLYNSIVRLNDGRCDVRVRQNGGINVR